MSTTLGQWKLPGKEQMAMKGKEPASGFISGDVSPRTPRASQGFRLTEATLLELCDASRAGLIDGNTPRVTVQSATSFLEAAALDEMCGIPSIGLGIIRKARLDKLLIDILNPENHLDTGLSYPWPRTETAARLQRQWRARFRGDFFDLDKTRYQALPKTGPLRGVTFRDVADSAGDSWRATATEALSEVGRDSQYEAGQDGIVDSARERPTMGPHGVKALPLLTGSEKICSPPGIVKFVGKQVHILRGYRLRSPLAPRAGVRYDGKYIIRQYGQRFNDETCLDRMEITLERVPGQRSIIDICKVPWPSQLDDWLLYEKYEGEIVRQRRGEQGFVNWKTTQANERLNLEEWRRALQTGNELKLARLSQSGSSMSIPGTMGKNDKKGGDKPAAKGKGGGGDKETGGGKSKGAQSINVRHILCEKHAKKEEALAKLNEGVKFDEVARNYSEDKARQGGSLGWKSKGSLDPKFEEVAFALEPSTTSSPKIGEAKTGFGYHIIMVEGRK
ncbi:lysozyme [Purpureocillium lavendulum]|uniref:peptidylprolyl isomerase n=1 Tax=Purpureocillium lavendulum TaxID=1247861 RepID=A0AB34G5S0_9HYPO|nr:lysozyme [Purpureocillium lavendulum]